MNKSDTRTNVFFSLKFQLSVGAVMLIGLAIASISYFLIEHQKHILTEDLKTTIVLQARNVALSSAKSLLRPDPEFELVPLVTRITEGNEDIQMLVISDASGVVQADMELQNIGTPLALDLASYPPVGSDLLGEGEALARDRLRFLVKTPIVSLDKVIGYVYMAYSGRQLIAAISRSVKITVAGALIAFLVGFILALLTFRRISQPMDVMMQGVNSLGQGKLDTRIVLPTRNEFRLLANSFNQMASRLQTAQKDLVEKEIMDRELAIAHEIQRTLIPSDVESPKGYGIGVHYSAAKQVGGDYVDIIHLDADRVAFVVADVSGKGIPGLVVMAMLRILVRELLQTRPDITHAVRQLNESIHSNVHTNMFVTMFLAVLDTKTGRVTYTNAGHCPMLFIDKTRGQIEYKRIPGRPLGLFSDGDFFTHLRQDTLTMRPGDMFVLFTDGLHESRNGNREAFGYERIANVCRRSAAPTAQVVIATLVDAEKRFRGDRPQGDDLTVLAVGATGTPRLEQAVAREVAE